MSRRSDLELLSDIKEAIQWIISYCEDMEIEQFLKDQKTKDAVVRNFEIIGEATKNITQNFQNQYPAIPWGDMAKFRDRLIHQYSAIDFAIVWDTVVEFLPGIALQIQKAIQKEGQR